MESLDCLFYRRNLMLVFHMMEETGTITIVGISNDSKKRSGSGGAPTADTTTTTTKSDRRDRGTSIAAAATTVPKSLRPIADRSIGRKLSVSGDPSEFTCADSSYFLKVDTISTHYRDDSALYKHYHRQEVDQLVKENIAYLQQQQQHRKPSPEGTHTKQQRRCCSNRTWLISENVECQLLGSTIVSINGVSMHGLDKHFQRKLLEQRKRPLYMKVQPSHYHLTASPVSISGQTLYTISSLQSRSDSSSSAVIKPKMVYDKISNQLFLSKYGSSYASKIRSKVDSITKDYLECDWKYQSRLSPQATLPQATVVSLYRYIESEMSKLELFNGKHKRGMSMPTELLEEHWDNIRSHIEMLVFNKVSDFTHRLWPLYREDYIKVNRDYEDLFNASSAAAAATGGSQKPAIIVAEEFIEIDLNLSARHRSGNGWAAAASSPSSSSSYPEVRIELSTDHSLYMKLAYMRFLTLRHVGLSGTSSDDDDDNSIDDGSRLQLGLHMMHMNNTLAQQEIWYLCMAEMTAAMLCTTPGEVLEKLVSAVHMIYHALGSYLNPDAMYAGDDRVVEQGRNHSCCGCESMHLLPQSTEQSSEERSPAIGAADTQMISIPTPSSSSSSDEYSMVCEQLSSILKDTTLLISAPASPDEAIDIKDISLESIGSESPKGTTRSHHHTLSADDLMPAITWVLIQANPPDVEYVVWMCNEFRHPSLVKGEEAFCLAQLSSALEFCRTSSFTSFDIQQDTYNAYLIRYNNTLKLLLSCKKGDVSSIRRLLKDGVDVNGLSPDYKDCPLTACIRYGRVEAFRCLLEVPSIDIHNTVVNLYSGSAPHQRCSILIVAAQCAQLDIVLLLLSRGADRHYKDDSGTTASSAIQSVIDSTSSSTSKSSSKSTNQSSSSNNSSSSNSNSNSMGKGDNNDAARLFLKKLELEYIELCLRIEPVCSMDLIDAIELDDQSAVAGLLLQRVPLNCLNTGVDSKLSPLIAAVHSEHMSILRILLNKHLCPHLDINYPNASGETALIVCVKECIKNPSQQLVCKAGMLLRAGADRYLVDIDNMSAMDYMSRGIESFTAFTRDILSSSAAKYDQSPPWEDRQVTSVAYSSIIADIQRQGGAQLNDAQKRLVIEEKMDALLDLQALLSNDPIGNDALQPNSNSTNNSKGNSKSKSVPIYGHAKAKNLHAVKALLYQGVDANEVCPEKNYSSLIAAVYNGDLAMLQVLLQANKLYRLTSTYDSSASKLARLNRYCYVKAGVGSTNISVIRSPDPVDHITVDVNQPDSTGMNALHYAAQIGNPSIVGALLQAGANRTSLNNKSHSPLDIATAHEHAEATDILRYDPQVVSICLAAKHGDWGVMKALLAQGESINAEKEHFHKEDKSRVQHDLYTPLIAAAAYGQVELLRKMLALPDIDVNKPNKKGQTALMFCSALGGDESLVLLLLKRGADRWIIDSKKEVAADWAKRHGHSSIQLLLTHDPSRTYIHELIRQSDFPAVVAMLKQDVDPNQRRFSTALHHSEASPTTSSSSSNSSGGGGVSRRKSHGDADHQTSLTYFHGETPLIVAARHERMDILALLLRAPPIDLNCMDSQRWTALHHAAFMGKEKAVLMLLKAGVSRAIRNTDLLTASSVAKNAGFVQVGGIIDADPYIIHIHDACHAGKMLLVIGLLKQGCPSTFRDSREGKMHRTPLMAACQGQRVDVVKHLLGLVEVCKGIDAQDDEGQTALIHAASIGAMNLTSLLLAAGANRFLTDNRGLSAKDYASKHSFSAYFQFARQTMWS